MSVQNNNPMSKKAGGLMQMNGPGGVPSDSPQAAMQLSYPMRPAGGAFLQQHAAFTDARPPAARGQRKGAGYPSFGKSK